MDIKKELDSNQTILLLMKSTEYNDVIVDVAKQLSTGNTCYITSNKTFESLKEIFTKSKINFTNMVFIDSIAKTFTSKPKESNQVYFVSSPGALTELSLVISKFLRHNFDYLIFDSLTNLATYQKKTIVNKFMANLVNKVKKSNTKAVFYALNIKGQEDLFRQSSMFVDKVLKT
jgi:archaellum biogenesis ATPase FlaH